jgi:hypothetical protein
MQERPLRPARPGVAAARRTMGPNKWARARRPSRQQLEAAVRLEGLHGGRPARASGRQTGPVGAGLASSLASSRSPSELGPVPRVRSAPARAANRHKHNSARGSRPPPQPRQSWPPQTGGSPRPARRARRPAPPTSARRVPDEKTAPADSLDPGLPSTPQVRHGWSVKAAARQRAGRSPRAKAAKQTEAGAPRRSAGPRSRPAGGLEPASCSESEAA